MNCRSQDHIPDHVLSAYIEGDLDETESGRVKNHIDGCSVCQERVSALRKLDLTWKRTIEIAQKSISPSVKVCLSLSQKIAYILGKISPEEERIMRSHLMFCRACRANCEQLALRLADESAIWNSLKEIMLLSYASINTILSNIAKPIAKQIRLYTSGVRIIAVRVPNELSHVQRVLGVCLSGILGSEYHYVEHRRLTMAVNPAHPKLSPSSKPAIHIIWNAPKRGDLDLFSAQAEGIVIALGKPSELDAISPALTPCQSYSMKFGEEEQKSIHDFALKYHNEILSKQSESMQNAIKLILMLASFDLPTPFSWFPDGKAFRQEAQNEEMLFFLTPIDPADASTPVWNEARYITASSDSLAVEMFKVAKQFSADTLYKQCHDVLGRAFSKNEQLAQEEINLIYLLLHSLALNRRRVAYKLVQDYAQELVRLQAPLNDIRHIHAWAKLYRAIGYRQTNMKAEELYGRALKIEEKNIYLLNAYATFLGEQRRYLEAQRHFREIEKLDGLGNIHVLTSWAGMLLKWGENLDEARRMLMKACELEPDNPYPLNILGLLRQKAVYFAPVEQAKDFQRGLDDSEAYLLRAIEIDKNNIPSLHALGHLARERGHLQRSERWFRKVLDFDPENIYAMVELGRIHTERAKENMDGADREATSCFQQALELSDDNIHSLTAWSDLDIKMGRSAESEHRLQKAADIASERNEPIAAIETTRVKLEIMRGAIDKDRKMEIVQLLGGLSENVDPNVRLIARNLYVKILWITEDKKMADQVFHKVLRESITPRIINNYAALLSKDATLQHNCELFSKADEWYQRSLACDLKNAYTHLGHGLNLINWAEIDGDRTRRETGEKSIQEAASLGLDVPEVKEAMQHIG